jgi:hypothetical protein
MEHETGKSVPLLPAAVIVLLVFPNRLAYFLRRLFRSNPDVLKLAIIHLQQLSPPGIIMTPTGALYHHIETGREKSGFHAF